MGIQLEVDRIESAIDQLRKQSQLLQSTRQLSRQVTLSSFSRASGLDEAGGRLSPIGDERAPEANQAIALYLKSVSYTHL